MHKERNYTYAAHHAKRDRDEREPTRHHDYPAKNELQFFPAHFVMKELKRCPIDKHRNQKRRRAQGTRQYSGRCPVKRQGHRHKAQNTRLLPTDLFDLAGPAQQTALHITTRLRRPLRAGIPQVSQARSWYRQASLNREAGQFPQLAEIKKISPFPNKPRHISGSARAAYSASTSWAP